MKKKKLTDRQTDSADLKYPYLKQTESCENVYAEHQYFLQILLRSDRQFQNGI